MNLDYLGLVFKDIANKKLSSFLTFFAISLGILSIFVIIILSSGFENSISKQFEQMGSNRLYITASTTGIGPTVTKGLSDNEVNIVKNRPFVIEAYPYYIRAGQITYSNEIKKRSLIGIDITKEHFDSFNLELEEGRLPKSGEKYAVVIGPEFANNLFEKDVKIGSNVYIKETKFKVVGILKSIGNPEDDKAIYIDMDTLRNLFDEGENVGMIYAIIEENYDLELASQNLKILLENKLGKDSIEIVSPAALLESFNTILDIVKYTLGGIAFVSLLVGSLGIINTMYVIVTEKVKDIGIMKSVGATNGNILTMFMFQAGIFGLLGGILGISFGSLIGLAFESIAKQSGFSFLEINIDLAVVLELLLFSFLIGIFSGFLPAKKASKLKVIDAIRK